MSGSWISSDIDPHVITFFFREITDLRGDQFGFFSQFPLIIIDESSTSAAVLVFLLYYLNLPQISAKGDMRYKYE